MEADGGKLFLRHTEEVLGFSKGYVASLDIACHLLHFAQFEPLQSVGIRCFDPARFIERDGGPAALCAILVEQSELDYFELQRCR